MNLKMVTHKAKAAYKNRIALLFFGPIKVEVFFLMFKPFWTTIIKFKLPIGRPESEGVTEDVWVAFWNTGE